MPGGPIGPRAGRGAARGSIGFFFFGYARAAMSVKKVLLVIGTLAALAAVVMGVVSFDDRSVNPIGAIALAVAAYGVLKASEYW